MNMDNIVTRQEEFSEEDYHFGQRIVSFLRQEGRSISWFADKMNSDRSNMYKILARPHLNSEFILRASRILKHDFFKDISDWLNSTNADTTAS